MTPQPNRYGFMREVESKLIDELLETIKTEFGELRFLEIGVFTGDTARGIARRSKEIGLPCTAAGVDFVQYNPNPPPDCPYTYYAGDSMEQFRNVTGSYNFLFVDGCHCVVHASQDFLHYSPFVQVGGYALFHDTALPTDKFDQEPWPQDHSYAGKENSKLGVREALKKLGLLQGHRKDWQFVKEEESNTGLMGMILMKKILDL